MSELWADIKGFEGLYQVSNLGNVKSLPRRGTYSTPHILAVTKDQKGYLMVGLSKNSKLTTRRVHRLVAEAFIPNLDNLPEVNHLDENKNNNTVSNLEWCTRKYNVNYGTRTDKTQKPVIQISKSGEIIAIYESLTSIKEILKVNNISNISEVCKGKRKSAYGYKWKFRKEN